MSDKDTEDNAVDDFKGMALALSVIFLWLYAALWGWGFVDGSGFLRWVLLFYLPTIFVWSLAYATFSELIRRGEL